MGINKLLELNDTALDWDELGSRDPNTDTIHGASPLAVGVDMPKVSEAIGAMLIMGGCVATFQGYYWHVVHKITGKSTNVSLRCDEHEWQECLAKIGDQTYG